MQHASARRVVGSILDASGFAERALALTLAFDLADAPDVPAPVAAKLRERAQAMAPDGPGANAPIGVLTAPVPADQAQLTAQLAPVVVANPAQTGLQVGCLEALCSLWPHIASDERPRLRHRFLAGVAARQAPAVSWVSERQLHAWQRDQPTACGLTAASVASLKALLEAPSAEAAYHVLAEHLGCHMDLPTLTGVLGTLCMRLLVQFRDPQGLASQALLGAVAAQRLCGGCPPEALATMVAQLAHQVWWCRAEGGLPAVRGCIDATVPPFLAAVRSGDITAAQRAGRTASSESPATFWQTLWQLLGEAAELDDRTWLRALVVVAAVARRNAAPAISPDDAAALGTVLADLSYARSGSGSRIAVAAR